MTNSIFSVATNVFCSLVGAKNYASTESLRTNAAVSVWEDTENTGVRGGRYVAGGFKGIGISVRGYKLLATYKDGELQ